jgi:hypothetical protein
MELGDKSKVLGFYVCIDAELVLIDASSSARGSEVLHEARSGNMA